MADAIGGVRERIGGSSRAGIRFGRGMAEHLPILSADEEETLLRDAGFSDVWLFYAGFSFRGWVAQA